MTFEWMTFTKLHTKWLKRNIYKCKISPYYSASKVHITNTVTKYCSSTVLFFIVLYACKLSSKISCAKENTLHRFTDIPQMASKENRWGTLVDCGDICDSIDGLLHCMYFWVPVYWSWNKFRFLAELVFFLSFGHYIFLLCHFVCIFVYYVSLGSFSSAAVKLVERNIAVKNHLYFLQQSWGKDVNPLRTKTIRPDGWRWSYMGAGLTSIVFPVSKSLLGGSIIHMSKIYHNLVLINGQERNHFDNLKDYSYTIYLWLSNRIVWNNYVLSGRQRNTFKKIYSFLMCNMNIINY